MSNPGQSTRSLYVPFPKDGLNLLNDPVDLQPTEALVIQNFLVLDSGLQQSYPSTNTTTYATEVARVFGFYDVAGAQHRIECADHKIYVDGVDQTGAVVISTNQWQSCQFNRFVFLTNGTDQVARVNVTTGAATAAVFTSTDASWPGNDHKLIQGCNFKGRPYFIENSSTGNGLNIWYGHNVGAVTGALDLFPIDSIVRDSGSILFVCPWSYNQGLDNDDLFVIVMTSGEVIIYQGDYPASTNWAIKTRTTIPIPIGNRAWKIIGQDVYVATVRGILSLEKVFAGIKGDLADEGYYAVSRKLGQSTLFGNVEIAVDSVLPVMYFLQQTQISIAAYNYELKAWSILVPVLSNGSEAITGMCFIQGSLFVCTNLKKVWKVSDSGYDPATNIQISSYWQTPYFTYESDLQHSAKLQRVLYTNTGQPTMSCQWNLYTAVNFEFEPFITGDLRTFSALAQNRATVEFSTPGTGRQISYYHYLNSINMQQNILGMWTYVDEGGVY